MKKSFAILLIIMLLAAAGCQKTPEEPIVIQKDTDRLVEQLQDTEKEETVLFDREAVPTHIEKEIQGKTGKITIDVDADVVLPEADEIPVYRVKAADFSPEMTTLMFDRFRNGKEMYEFPETETKEQIAEKILLAREQLEGRLNDPILKHDTELIERNRKALEEFLAEYEKAPDKSEGTLVSGMLEEKVEYDEKGKAIGTYDAAGGEDAERTVTFYVENNTDYKKIPDETVEAESDAGVSKVGYQEKYLAYMFYSVNEKQDKGEYARNYAQHPMLTITDENRIPEEAEEYLHITPAEARAMAEELLAGTGMVISGIYLTDDEDCGNFGGIVSPAENYAYKLLCVREIDGVKTFYRDGGSQRKDDAFAPVWSYERMEMMVDDDGIFNFEWRAPIELTEKITENAKILPFEKIQSIFEKMILIEYEGLQEYEKYKNCELLFEIDGIELLLHRIPEANSDDTGLVIPVWCFYGEGYTVDAEGNKESLYLWNDGTPQAVLMINAVDGSIVEIPREGEF